MTIIKFPGIMRPSLKIQEYKMTELADDVNPFLLDFAREFFSLINPSLHFTANQPVTNEQIDGFRLFVQTWVDFVLDSQSKENQQQLLSNENPLLEKTDLHAFAERLNKFGQKYLFHVYRGKGERTNMIITDLPDDVRKNLAKAFKKMGIFEGGFLPTKEQIQSCEIFGVYGAAQVRFNQREETLEQLIKIRESHISETGAAQVRFNQREKTPEQLIKIRKSDISETDDVNNKEKHTIVSFSGSDRPLWYYAEDKKTGTLIEPEPITFELMATKKCLLSIPRIKNSAELEQKIEETAEEIRTKAREIFLSLPKEIRSNATWAADAINQYRETPDADPYFKGYTVTEADLAHHLARKFYQNHSDDKGHCDYKIVVLETKSTFDENGNRIRATTETTTETFLNTSDFSSKPGFMISDSDSAVAQGITLHTQKIIHDIDNPSLVVLALPTKSLPEFTDILTQDQAINMSVTLVGAIKQVYTFMTNTRSITQQKQRVKSTTRSPQ